MKKFRYLLVVGIIILDQVTKFAVRQNMYIGESIPLIKDVFHLTYVQNRGGAFSILTGQGFILTVVPLAAVSFALWYMEKHINEHWSLFLSLSLIASGGVGNLIDRVFFGFVTDMIDFRFFPVFNIADIAVCVGAGFLILYTMYYSDNEDHSKTEQRLG
ncbi:MAG: signal peptidase II [Anaerovoracaceae bacterium]|nr:signal peptidase II [Bacillota bacterium]MEE0516605.1 signal peptidase II [Anaerovoracaceae bacterium]